MCIDYKELNKYKTLNTIAHMNSVVIVGSTNLKEMPVGELKQIFGIISDIYNRSLSDLSIFEAKDIIKDIITELIPKKIVLQLGEVDIENDKNSVDDVIAEYSEIIKTIKKMDKSIDIVVVSVNTASDKGIEREFNRKLEELSLSTKTQYADITSVGDNDASRIKTFRLLRYFMTDDIAFSIM